MSKTKRLIRQGKREGRRDARREEREKLREETGHRFPKLRKAAGFMWGLAKWIPFRPLGGAAMTAGEMVEDVIKERENETPSDN